MNSSTRTVVVTGASRRLGLLLCEKFLAQGDQVIAVTRAPSEELNAVQAEYKESLTIELIAQYDGAGARTLAERMSQRYSQIDVLIHNASIFHSDAVAEEDVDQYFGAMFNIHMAVPAALNMGLKSLLEKSDRADIIHITDIYAENPKADHTLYCSTKAGLDNMAKGFAKKFAPGIRVNVIQPGPIQFLPEHDDEHRKAVLAQTLLEIEGGFLPIFQAVQGILNNDFMTGATIKVDGGRALKGW